MLPVGEVGVGKTSPALKWGGRTGRQVLSLQVSDNTDARLLVKGRDKCKVSYAERPSRKDSEDVFYHHEFSGPYRLPRSSQTYEHHQIQQASQCEGPDIVV